MPSRFRAVPGLALAAALLGCTDAGPSYTRIEIERSRALLESDDVAIVDATSGATAEPEPLPGSTRWILPERGPAPEPEGLPTTGAVLVVGNTDAVAHRAAATMARRGNHPVYVFIPRDANERVSLYAVARQTKEASRGEDS